MKTIHLITMLKLIGWMCGNDVNFKEDLYIYKILIYLLLVKLAEMT